VIFLDLDGFKDINDQFGREVGDELLRLLGDRLCQSVRKADFVARHGGDEFVVVARTENDRDLERLSQRLVRAIEHPTELAGGSIRLSASAGLAHPYPQTRQRRSWPGPTRPCSRPRSTATGFLTS